MGGDHSCTECGRLAGMLHAARCSKGGTVRVEDTVAEVFHMPTLDLGRVPAEGLDRMMGADSGEHAARTALALALGPAFRVTQTIDRDAGDELLIAWDGGGVSIRAERLRLAMVPDDDLDEEDRPITVDRHGSTFAITREELRGWRRLKGPWYRLRAWWGF